MVDAANMHAPEIVMSLSGLYAKAADIVSQPGKWTRHVHAVASDGYNDDYPAGEDGYVAFCMIGACRAAIPGNAKAVAGVTTLHDIEDPLHDLVPGGDARLWNDAPERTQSEVAAKLREAAERFAIA